MTTRSELLDLAIDLQSLMRTAKAKQMEDEEINDPDDTAVEYWKGVRAGLGQAEIRLQRLINRAA